MPWRRNNLKSVTVHLLATSIVANGFVGYAQSGVCTDLPSARFSSECSRSRCCCCPATGEGQSCCCGPQQNPPLPPAAALDEGRVGLNWMQWVNPPSVVFEVAACERGAPLPSQHLFFPLGRSVQLLLCIWRI